MEKVWINKGNPRQVIEKDDVHYFYFPVELGIGKIRILGVEIPLPLPIKFPDYEPIKLFKLNGKTQVASRFHYQILTYFNYPKIVRNRAIVDFTLGSHSPYVHSEDNSRLGTKIAMERLGAVEAQFARLLILICQEIVSGRKKIKIESLNNYDVERGEIPDEAMFELRKCHSVIWVGTFPEKRDTPAEVWHVLKS